MQKGLRYALQQDTATQSGLLYAPLQSTFYHLQMWPNSNQYFVQNVQAIMPTDKDGKVILQYGDTQLPAVISVGRKSRIVVAGFPFESVMSDEQRRYLMRVFVDELY